MSKRELERLNGGNEIEGPRTKRRRETVAATSPEVDVIQSDPVVPGGDEVGEAYGGSKELVQEQGLKLWQTVRDAVNKEGRTLSLDFIRRPSKRQYPDYYRLIHQPIALEEIRKKLDNAGYPSLDAVKDDFDLCFNNAKQYNQKDSIIWSDAKELQKLVHKAYGKIHPTDEDGENADGEGKGKSKGPNLSRLIKGRLQKLVDKTDESGRVLSTEFMELPSKREWPIYYKTIKKPQCLENIFKRIKRKEYYNAGEFAADVELVFANALSFNQEHTPIWEDAKALRDYFRQLLSDMPPPFALAEYSRPSNGKIKIKMPAAVQPAASSSSANARVAAPAPAPPAQPNSPLVLRVPPVNPPKPSPAATPTTNDVSLPVAAATSPVPPVTAPASAVATPTIPVQPIPYVNNSFSHYQNATYTPPTAPQTMLSTTNLPVSNALPRAQSSSDSPSPSSHNPLKAITLKIQSTGRSLTLDYRDGVKCWALRLVPGETGVHIDEVTFLDDDEEEESSGDEEEDNDAEDKKDGEDEEMEDVPAKSTRKKARGKGRGKSKVTKATKPKATPAKKKKQKATIQATLNGTLVKGEQDTAKWILQISPGMNVLEIGESGGSLWKVYIQRAAS